LPALETARVAESVRQAQEQPAIPPQPVAKRQLMVTPSDADTDTCYAADTPGRPPTVILGTPPIGNSSARPRSSFPALVDPGITTSMSVETRSRISVISAEERTENASLRVP